MKLGKNNYYSKKVDNEYIQGPDAVAREEYNKIFNQKIVY